MRRIAAALAAAALATTAAALPPPPPPSISRITPPSGLPGTLVTIDGELFLPFGVQPCAADCGVTVSFGDVVAKAESASYERITVRAPDPVRYGLTDITVRGPVGVAFAKNGFRYTSGNFDDLWAPVLLPLWLDATAAGARGSRWSTELWLRNGGDELLSIIPWDCSRDPRHCFSERTLEGAESLRNLPPGPPRAANVIPNDAPIPPARVLYVWRDAAPSLQARLLLRETKSGTVTDLPTVREDGLFGPLDIIGVPVLPNARATLRIYGVNDTYDVVDVYVFSQHEGADDVVALAAQRVLIQSPFTESEAFTAYPAYAEVDLAPLLRGAGDAAHIAIVPIDNVLPRRFWAMVSITDNDTQRVTIATP